MRSKGRPGAIAVVAVRLTEAARVALGSSRRYFPEIVLTIGGTFMLAARGRGGDRLSFDAR